MYENPGSVAAHRSGPIFLKFYGRYTLNLPLHPSPLLFVRAVLALRAFIRAQRYTVIETSSISTNLLAAWAARSTEANVAIGIHHVFERADFFRTKMAFWWLTLQINSAHIYYYATSEYCKTAALRFFLKKPPRFPVIYNCIRDDIKNSKLDYGSIRREFNIPEDAGIILYVGRIAKYKNCIALVSAFADILCDKNLYLCFVGEVDPSVPGSQSMLAEMRARVHGSPASDHIIYAGRRKDVAQFMHEASVLVHPTLKEAFGLVLVESLALGLPIVATNVEAIPEILSDTASIIVPASDIVALRSAVLKVLDRTPEEANTVKRVGLAKSSQFTQSMRTTAMLKWFNQFDRLRR